RSHGGRVHLGVPPLRLDSARARSPRGAAPRERGCGLARIVGGLLGWIASVTPLIVVNIFGALGVLSWDDAFIASAVALLVGPLLGGLVAGYLVSRPGRQMT